MPRLRLDSALPERLMGSRLLDFAEPRRPLW